MMVSNDGGFAGAALETLAYKKPWTITQYGAYTIPRTVYVRFKDFAGNVSATYSDDIILDVTPPTGSVTIAGSTSGTGAAEPAFLRRPATALTYTVYLPLAAKSLQVTLLLSATDDVSGVGSVLISNNADFSGADWEAYASRRTWNMTGHTVYVKFRDNAGNVSPVYWAAYTP